MIAAYLRIKKAEEMQIDEISKKLNRERLDHDLPVMKESEILHEIINQALKRVTIKNGKIEIK